MSITSDEINYLIYRYLQENGFLHSAFTFSNESMVLKSSVASTELCPGALITFLQKGLEYIGIEENITEDGQIKEFDLNFSLLSPFVCDAVANKEDRRVRRKISNESSSDEPNQETPSLEASSQSNQMVITQSHSNTTETNQVDVSNLMNVTVRKDNGLANLNLTGHQGEVFMCVWNPKTAQLASGSADGICRLWNLEDIPSTQWSSINSSTTTNTTTTNTTIALKTYSMPHTTIMGEKHKDITSITWKPDGLMVATGCYNGEIRIWETHGKCKLILREHTGPVFSLKWNKSGQYLLSGSYDQRTIIWNPDNGTIVKVFRVHVQPVLDVDWRDSDIFASCSSDTTINICKVSSPESIPIASMIGHEDEVNAVVWSPGGVLLASCSDDKTAKIWSIENGLLHTLHGHSKEIFTLRWTQSDAHYHPEIPLYLCTASFDGTVKVWDGVRGILVYSLEKNSQPVYSVSPSPSGLAVAIGSLGGHVSVWSLRDGSQLHEMIGPGDTFDVSWSNNGQYLSACFSSGTVIVQDASSLHPKLTPSLPILSNSNSSSTSSTSNNISSAATSHSLPSSSYVSPLFPTPLVNPIASFSSPSTHTSTTANTHAAPTLSALSHHNPTTTTTTNVTSTSNPAATITTSTTTTGNTSNTYSQQQQHPSPTLDSNPIIPNTGSSHLYHVKAADHIIPINSSINTVYSKHYKESNHNHSVTTPPTTTSTTTNTNVVATTTTTTTTTTNHPSTTPVVIPITSSTPIPAHTSIHINKEVTNGDSYAMEVVQESIPAVVASSSSSSSSSTMPTTISSTGTKVPSEIPSKKIKTEHIENKATVTPELSPITNTVSSSSSAHMIDKAIGSKATTSTTVTTTTSASIQDNTNNSHEKVVTSSSSSVHTQSHSNGQDIASTSMTQEQFNHESLSSKDIDTEMNIATDNDTSIGNKETITET